MVKQELERINQTLNKAIELLQAGKLKQAGRLANQLRNSWAVSEASRAEAIIEGYSFLFRKKPTCAKKRCLDSIGYLWDDPDGLFIIRQINPKPNVRSKWYDIAIQGGAASLGSRVCFDLHTSRFLVLADDEFEAIRYVDELAKYQKSESKCVVDCLTRRLQSDDEFDKKGVYRCSPFTIEELPDPFIEEGEPNTD